MVAMRKSIYTAEYAALRQILREIRLGAELSQRDLAARLDVPHTWVAKVESGERRIDLIEFGRFCCACGVSPVRKTAVILANIKSTDSGQTHRRRRNT
ncbi:MAG: helix-turn-helix domain-containing protein [Phycisphaerales bacterium]